MRDARDSALPPVLRSTRMAGLQVRPAGDARRGSWVDSPPDGLYGEGPPDRADLWSDRSAVHARAAEGPGGLSRHCDLSPCATDFSSASASCSSFSPVIRRAICTSQQSESCMRSASSANGPGIRDRSLARTGSQSRRDHAAPRLGHHLPVRMEGMAGYGRWPPRFAPIREPRLPCGLGTGR
jgi:hypothetical protein